MAKTKEVTAEPTTKESKQPKVLSVDDLKKMLKEKEELKTVIENEYFKITGQLQFLLQQIKALEG